MTPAVVRRYEFLLITFGKRRDARSTPDYRLDTIAGARQKLRQLGHDRSNVALPESAGREVQLRAALLGVREEFVGLLDRLDEIEREAVEATDAPSEVTVHQAVPVFARKKHTPYE